LEISSISAWVDVEAWGREGKEGEEGIGEDAMNCDVGRERSERGKGSYLCRTAVCARSEATS